jgi:hypothetical protein
MLKATRRNFAKGRQLLRSKNIFAHAIYPGAPPLLRRLLHHRHPIL